MAPTETPALEVGISRSFETFDVWHKETGAKFLADVRTFDPEVHSKEPVEAPPAEE